MGTGRPVPSTAGKYNDWNGVGIPTYGERNNYRVPVYHRMDLSLNIFPNYRTDRKLKGSWTFGLVQSILEKTPILSIIDKIQLVEQFVHSNYQCWVQ
ncbi:MAG: hypothetical protein IPL23_22540 [Saprospiraceae bacterium]|nr:hypothetical protein [Saprospiraceae bacterium]